MSVVCKGASYSSAVYTSTCRKAIPTGMLSGGMGQFLASPTDLVKTRLQMEGRRLLDGHKPRLVSMAQYLLHFLDPYSDNHMSINLTLKLSFFSCHIAGNLAGN